MGKLTYSLNVSLDGFVETVDHSLDWASVDEELHSWFNDQARGLDASIYGRRMYELMAGYWPTVESDPSATPAELDFGRIWRPMPKIVFSKTLEKVDWNSRIVRGEVTQELQQLRTEFHGDMDVGGATLAASFIRAGLIDEYQLLVHPVALGEGTPFFPRLEQPLRLRLTETKRFESGVEYLRYVNA
jgi:dihydrofolate reductase